MKEERGEEEGEKREEGCKKEREIERLRRGWRVNRARKKV
jgi:hypothetical protein